MMERHDRVNSGIYQIRNLANGKIYVGSAVNIRNRWAVHRKDLKKGKHHSIHLQRAWAKHGEDQFVFEILEAVDNADDLIRIEQEYLDRLRPCDQSVGYNISKIAGSPLGTKRSPEVIAQMSERARRYGSDPEFRAKISAKMKGRPLNPEHRARVIEALIRRNKDAEFRSRNSESQKKRGLPPASREAFLRRGRECLGKKQSPEHVRKATQARVKARMKNKLDREIKAGQRLLEFD